MLELPAFKTRMESLMAVTEGVQGELLGGKAFSTSDIESRRPADETALPRVEPQRQMRITRDANPSTGAEIFDSMTVVRKEQGTLTAQIGAVEVPVDRECGSEPSRPAGKIPNGIDAAECFHLLHSRERLRRAYQDASRRCLPRRRKH